MLLHRSEMMKSNYCCYASTVIRAWRTQLQTNLTTEMLLLQAHLEEYLKIYNITKTGGYQNRNCAHAFIRNFQHIKKCKLTTS